MIISVYHTVTVRIRDAKCCFPKWLSAINMTDGLEKNMTMARISIVVAFHILCTCTSANAQSLEWSKDDAQRLSDAVSSGKYGRLTSVWIEQDGEVLYEEYFHETDSETFHNMRSAGKTITGMLVGTAIDDGLIEGVHSKAASFFDDLRPFENGDQRKEDITLEDLLTMSGPLECDDWNSFSRGNEERMYLVEDWSSFFWNLPIKNRPSWEIPQDDGGFDRLFSYCTAGIQLIGEIVERAVDATVPDYAASRLFEPIGIKDPKWNTALTGQAHLGGGLELATADWARAGRLYVNRGRMGGAQIVSESWIDASFADYVKIDDKTNYGYLWWRPQYEVFGEHYAGNMMSGSGGNRVYVLAEFGIVVVLTKSDFQDREAHAKSDDFFITEIVGRLRPE